MSSAAATTPRTPGCLCSAMRIGTGWRNSGRSRSRFLCTNSVNGVISNGFAPRVFSAAGSVISVNWTWQDGHHDKTSPVLLCDSLSSVLSAKRPNAARSPARNC